MNDALKTVLKNSGTIVLYAAIVFLIFIIYGNLNNRWYRVVMVEGGSMSPSINFGDLIVVSPPVENIPGGKVVIMDVDGALVTHRLVSDYQGGRPETKGDANSTADDFSESNLRILGIARFRIPWLGYPFIYFRNLLSTVNFKRA